MSEDFDRLNPMRLTDKKGIIGPVGEVYDLDFSRESALFATSHGIDVGEENTSQRMAKIPDLFFFAFRKNNKKIPREKIDKLREANNGLPIEATKYLYSLLAQALASNVINLDDEGDGKNGEAMDLEMD